MDRTLEEVQHLLAHPPEYTRTYRVTAEVLEQIPLAPTADLRPLTVAETAELAEYLGADSEALKGPFKVADVHCPRCDRHIGFLDFVKTAVQREHHSVEKLREVLLGRNGAWLTIAGRDGGRPLDCANCGGEVARSDPHGYSGATYGYAFAPPR